MSLTSNTRLGPYEILVPLGAGGMGEVYRARDTRLDREVAIKVLPESLARDPLALARFEREAKAVAALSHPNILAIYDIGSHNEVSYVVTELLEGETLRERLGRAAISWRQAVEISASVADGLAAAHAKGVVHRDLKPENIFITTAGHVKILDFGLARMEAGVKCATGHTADSTPTMTLVTRPGMILGTLNYMSPEQVRGLQTDARSDIFSLGCVVYEMVAGRRAFTGDTPADTMTAILKEEPPSIRDSRSSIRPELDRVITRCLEKKPEQRFQSAPDLAFTLRAILADSGATPAPTRPRVPWLAKAAIVAVVAGALLVGAFMVRRELRHVRREARVTIDSLAVLPLENVSRDPEQEYFVDGMTEALISDLAKIGGLKVISRTSVMRYKATTRSLPEIAKELNVDAVVEGSVLRVGERVRITAQLIHAATDEHLWSESYDRDLRDVLRLQSEVARTIAQEIKVKLTPQEQARMVEARPVNPAAHEAYLKGRFYWNKRTPDSLNKAVEYFEQAIALDADWPLGYAGLADAYLLMPYYSSARPSEVIPKARTAAAKALELDETQAEAHASMGYIATAYDWNWAAAERESKRALALSPSYATGHHWYAIYLLRAGRHDEAIREINKAHELDPLGLAIGTGVGMMHYYRGDFSRAEIQLRKTLELESDFVAARFLLTQTLALQQRFPEAMAEAREAARLSKNNFKYEALLGYVCAKAGQPDEARRVLDEFADRLEEGYVAPTHFALIYVGLGEADLAFDWLSRAYQEHDVLLSGTLIDPALAPLRSDPRFADLVRRVGLPPLKPMPESIPSRAREAAGTPRDSAKPLPDGRGSDSPDGSHTHSGKITLAVLPFANDSGDAELDYLSDGVAESLINGFSRIDGLNTVPRSTAFRHKADSADPVQIGRQLSATAILTGRVLKRGENLTIQAELTDVAEGRQLWGERYQRKIDDLVKIERDIAGDITDALRLKLTGEEKQKLSRGYSENAEAYRLYLQGRFWWSKRTKEGFDNALRLLDQAVQIDPAFALAHTGIADTYSLLPLQGFLAPRDALAKARQAAERALQLDDELAEAHTSMGMVRFYLEWDLKGGEQDFQRAIKLNPRYATAHQWYALNVGIQGRISEARTELLRAIEVDPLAPIFFHNLGWISCWERDWYGMLSRMRAGLEFAPEFPLLHQGAGLALLELDQADNALAHFRKATELAPLSSLAAASLGYGLARTGHSDEARTVLNEWIELTKTRYVPPSDIAMMYVGLGEFDEAFRWLEKAVEARDTWMVFLGVLPQWEPLRSDPRYASLLRRVGLPAKEK